MRTGIIGISSKPSTALFSHNGGWTYILISIEKENNQEVDIIKDPKEIHNYSNIIVNEGLNYKKGSWNFFGGMQEYSIEMIKNLSKYKGKLFSYNEEIDWPSLFKRKELKELDYSIMPKVILKHTNNVFNKIIVGDSHSVSIYEPGYSIDRFDGATLYGSLNQNGRLRNYNFDNYSDVVLYFGNIDIRFHIHRNGGINALNNLILNYTKFASELVDKGINVTLQGLIPVEDESRKIPGTGLYKGEKYFGSREERQKYVDHFNNKLEYISHYHGYNYRGWNLSKDLFEAPKFLAMESRQSVHLRPSSYLYKEKFINHVESVYRLL